jgi:hypothetical protein
MLDRDTNLIPILVRELVCRMPSLNAATIYEHADVVTIRQNVLDESLDLVSMSEIRGIDGSASSERANLIPRGGVAVVALYEHDVGSSFGQCYRHGFSNTSCGACDERDPAV